MQVPINACDLLAVRRKPLTDISNGIKIDKNKLQMVQAEKAIAESMFNDSFKEKEIIKAQAIKTLNLMKSQLARSEHNLSIANSSIMDSEARRKDDLELITTQENKINELQREVSGLKDSLCRANSAANEYEAEAVITQDRISLMEHQINHQQIEYSGAINSLGEAKNEIVEKQRSIDDANRKISDLNDSLDNSIKESSNLVIELTEAQGVILELNSSLGNANQITVDLKELLSDADYRISELIEERVVNQSQTEKINSLENIILDLNNRIQSMTVAMISTNEAHAPVVVSMHLEREQFAARLFSLEKKLLDVDKLKDEQEENKKEKENLSQEVLLETEKYLETKFNDISSMIIEIENLKQNIVESTKTIRELHEVNNENSKKLNHRIVLLKLKLGAKTKSFNAASAVHRTHPVDLEESTSGMRYDNEILEKKVMILKKSMKEMDGQLILINAEKYSFEVEIGIRTNELHEVTSSLSEAEEDICNKNLEIFRLTKEIEIYQNQNEILIRNNSSIVNNKISQNSENESLQKEIDTLRSKYEELESEMKNEINMNQKDVARREEETVILTEKNMKEIVHLKEKHENDKIVLSKQNENQRKILIKKNEKDSTELADLWEIFRVKEVEKEAEQLDLKGKINCLTSKLSAKELELNVMLTEEMKLKNDIQSNSTIIQELKEQNIFLINQEMSITNNYKSKLENIENENIANNHLLGEKETVIQTLQRERDTIVNGMKEAERSLAALKIEASELRNHIEQVRNY